MNRTFAARLAELERLEAEREREEAPRVLTERDADELEDDEVLSEAGWALGPGRLMTAWNTGIFRLTFTNSAWHPGYWQRIADRAQVIADERGTIIFPMTIDEVAEAIDLIESGCLQVRPRAQMHQYSHHSCILPLYGAPGWHEHYRKGSALAGALDCALWQTRRLMGEPGALCDTAMAVLEVLRRMRQHESIA